MKLETLAWALQRANNEQPSLRECREMVMDCNMVVAFWNFKSHGTKFTADWAKSHSIPIEIFDVRLLADHARKVKA